MPFTMIRDDLTRQKTDAIVNAANTGLRPGGGVCGAIFRAAGYDRLEAACHPLAPVAVGDAVMTPGFDLPAKYVIHTPGPIWQGGMNGEEELLRSCYRSCLKLAREKGLTSVAFPLISSGIYGYPKAQAIKVAADTIHDFLCTLDGEDMDVRLVLYGQDAFVIGSAFYGGIKAFIEENEVRPDTRRRAMADEGLWVENNNIEHCLRADQKRRWPERRASRYQDADEALMPEEADTSGYEPVMPVDIEASVNALPPPAPRNADDTERHLRQYLKGLGRTVTFSQYLLQLIDSKGMKDSQVYNAANLDRRLYSKIHSQKDYKLGKDKVLALCIGLRLNVTESEALLAKAGYAFSDSSRLDLAVRWFIQYGNGRVTDLNLALAELNLPQLGSSVGA